MPLTNTAIVWEIRDTGNATYGGGFFAGRQAAHGHDPAISIDYSQRDSPILTLDNLATDGAGTGLSTATAGSFTHAMEGNLIYLTGGGATAGWYEIVTYNSGTSVTIDRSAGLNKSNVTGNVGGAVALDSGSLFFVQLPAGNTVYISGTQTPGGAQGTAIVPTITTPIKWIGYKAGASRTATPTGTDRPLIAMAAYGFVCPVYTLLENIRFTIDTTAGVSIGTGGYFSNCKVNGTSTAAITLAGSTKVISSEVTNSGGIGITMSATPVKIFDCYIHDCLTSGINIGNNNNVSVHLCVIDTCATGIAGGSGHNNEIVDNTIYNCSTAGLSYSSGYNAIFINNIIYVPDGATGVVWTTLTNSNFWDYNDIYAPGTGTLRTLVTAGTHDISVDPDFVDAAGGDFTPRNPLVIYGGISDIQGNPRQMGAILKMSRPTQGFGSLV